MSSSGHSGILPWWAADPLEVELAPLEESRDQPWCAEMSSIRTSVARAVEALAADAASLFLLSADGARLNGALVGWDWTRTSFVAEVESWPNVARALADDAARFLTATTAERAEEAWFERLGIRATICAPMAADGRVLGVLFFDYVAPRSSQVDLALAKRTADECARLLERAATTA